MYAIVRVDEFQGSEVLLKDKITVKCVVIDLEEAKREVERLNKLNPHSYYFWQYTQVKNEK